MKHRQDLRSINKPKLHVLLHVRRVQPVAHRVQNCLHLHLERHGRVALGLYIAQQRQRVRQQIRCHRQLQLVPLRVQVLFYHDN